MLEINLLPWRANERAKQKYNLIKLFILSGLGCLFLMSLLHFGLVRWIAEIKAQVSYWQEEVVKLSMQADRLEKMLLRGEQFQGAIKVAKTFQKDQLGQLELFSTLLLKSPADIAFSEITRLKGQIILSGDAQSVLALSELIAHFNNLSFVEKTRIIEIKKQPHTDRFTFRLQLIDTLKNEIN